MFNLRIPRFNFIPTTTNFQKHIKNPKVYMTLAHQNQPVAKIVIELFTKQVPKTAENFRQLFLGSYQVNGKPYSLKNTSLLSVIPGIGIKAGVENSIYGTYFRDENYEVAHNEQGILTTTSNNNDKNNGQFLILLNPAEYFDRKSVAFGQVVHGLEFLSLIEKNHASSIKDIQIQETGELTGKEWEQYTKKEIFDIWVNHPNHHHEHEHHDEHHHEEHNVDHHHESDHHHHHHDGKPCSGHHHHEEHHHDKHHH